MYYLGIDLGGTNIAAGIVDSNYQLVAKKSTPTGADRPVEAILDDMGKLCLSLLADNGLTIADIASAGIAAPGTADDATGRVMYANNLPFLRTPICKMLTERTGIQNIRLDNDANAAAWGEAVAGAAKGTSKSVMITLGTGVGGGIIIDNRIYSGFNAAGGELGHMVIEYEGRQCTCGRKGCWEAYSSATALIKMTREKIEECIRSGRKTAMIEMTDNGNRVSGRTAFNAMRAGDAAGKEVVDMYIGYLACGLVNIINIFQPEIVSIGGGISNEGDNLLRPLLPFIEKNRYGGDTVPATELRIAKLGNDAGIIGAALLGMQK